MGVSFPRRRSASSLWGVRVGTLSVTLAAGCASLAGLVGGDDGGDGERDASRDSGVVPTPAKEAGVDAGHHVSMDAASPKDQRTVDAAVTRDVKLPVDVAEPVDTSGPSGDAGSPGHDAGRDSGHDAGSSGHDSGKDSGVTATSAWSWVNTNTASSTTNGSTTTLASSVTSGVPLEVGELVIVAVDMASNYAPITIQKPANEILEPFVQVGPTAINGCLEVAAWGVVNKVPSGGGFLTMSVPAPNDQVGWEDLAMHVFAGGSPTPHLTLDAGFVATGGESFATSDHLLCGPVPSVDNGLGFFVSYVSGGISGVADSGAGHTFYMAADPAGNPSGFLTPTASGDVYAEMYGNGSDWGCMTFALSP
jgi:hypothetical protein